MAERASAVASLSVERSVGKEKAEERAAASAGAEKAEEEEDVDDWSDDREAVTVSRVAFVGCGLSARLGRCCAGRETRGT